MMNYDAVLEAVGAWNTPRVSGEFLIVPTFSTYPSNSLVQVYVEGGKETFVVSDGGGAIKTLVGAGYLGYGGVRLLSDIVRDDDVQVNGSGWIYSSGVVIKSLTSAITTVSEASRDAAFSAIRKFKPAPVIDFRHDLDLALQRHFRDAVKKHGHLLGASNKLHTFDYLIRANENNLIALDAVVPDSSSINAAVVAHMDLKAIRRPDVKQFIVYDSEQHWSSSDLALLSLGAPSVAYTSFYKIIDRIAA
jgi:hypothetical protein